MSLMLNEDALRELERDSQEVDSNASSSVADYGDVESIIRNSQDLERLLSKDDYGPSDGSPQTGTVDLDGAPEIIELDRAVPAKEVVGVPFEKKKTVGRKRDPIANTFIWISDTRVKCPDCSKELTGRVDVMKNHARVCKPKNRLVRQLSLSPAGTKDQVGTSTPTERPESTCNFKDWESPSPSKKPLRKFLDGMTEKERYEVDLQCGKFVFACNLPFRVVEHPEFIEFVQKLRPSYRPPSRRQVGSVILDKVHSEIIDNVASVITGKDVVILQDGWSTSQTSPVIAHSIHCGNKVHFLNAISTGTNSKTADYCLQLLEEAIKECEDTYKCTVVGVVTDNCSVMKSLRASLNEKRKDIIAYGCTAHYLNNIGKKITPTSSMDKIVKIQKYFRNHHFQSSALSEAKGNRPVMPANTRWNSQQSCLENFMENHTIYLDIMRRNSEKFENSIADLIRDSSLYDDAEKLLKTADPVAVSLDKSQRDTFTIAEAVAEWIDLRKNVRLQGNVKEYFKQTMKEALIPPVLASYVLHPKYRGFEIKSEEMEVAYEWMQGKSNDLAAMAMELEAVNDSYFPPYLMKPEVLSRTSASTFWSIIAKRNVFTNEACKISQQLMILPASASGIERCFSTLNQIMSDKRSNLAVEKASKLCKINRSLRFLKEDESE